VEVIEKREVICAALFKSVEVAEKHGHINLFE
jgi:hypothetical protein